MTLHTNRSARNLALCVGLIALAPASQAVTFSFGMQYSPIITKGPQPINPGPSTGCTATGAIAVGVEIHTNGSHNVGVQMLCATPSAIGFWTDTVRGNFVGASGTTAFQALCSSSTAITGVSLDIAGLDLSCAVMEPNFVTGNTSAGASSGATSDVITNDQAPISQAACSNEFVRTFKPTFAADGSMLTLQPSCDSIVNGLPGATLTTVMARTVGQRSFQAPFQPLSPFKVELFLFGPVPTAAVPVDITPGNLPEIPIQQDFNGSQFNEGCSPKFIDAGDQAHTQIFQGFHCPVSPLSFGSTGKFLFGTLEYAVRNAPQPAATLPIVTVNVEDVALTFRYTPTGQPILIEGITGVGAAFPVTVFNH